MAGERKLIDIIGSGFALFSHDESLEAMAGDPDHCAVIAAATADGRARLDLMIYLCACAIGSVRSQSRGFEPNFTHTGRHTPVTCRRSFRRLWCSASRIASASRTPAPNARAASAKPASSSHFQKFENAQTRTHLRDRPSLRIYAPSIPVTP